MLNRIGLLAEARCFALLSKTAKGWVRHSDRSEESGMEIQTKTGRKMAMKGLMMDAYVRIYDLVEDKGVK